MCFAERVICFWWELLSVSERLRRVDYMGVQDVQTAHPKFPSVAIKSALVPFEKAIYKN